jgi:hypothetical protein
MTTEKKFLRREVSEHAMNDLRLIHKLIKQRLKKIFEGIAICKGKRRRTGVCRAMGFKKRLQSRSYVDLNLSAKLIRLASCFRFQANLCSEAILSKLSLFSLILDCFSCLD